MLRYSGHALLLVLGTIFLLHSPFTQWWASLNPPWYTVFVIWLLLILLVALDNFSNTSENDEAEKDTVKNNQAAKSKAGKTKHLKITEEEHRGD